MTRQRESRICKVCAGKSETGQGFDGLGLEWVVICARKNSVDVPLECV